MVEHEHDADGVKVSTSSWYKTWRHHRC